MKYQPLKLLKHCPAKHYKKQNQRWLKSVNLLNAKKNVIYIQICLFSPICLYFRNYCAFLGVSEQDEDDIDNGDCNSAKRASTRKRKQMRVDGTGT